MAESPPHVSASVKQAPSAALVRCLKSVNKLQHYRVSRPQIFQKPRIWATADHRIQNIRILLNHWCWAEVMMMFLQWVYPKKLPFVIRLIDKQTNNLLCGGNNCIRFNFLHHNSGRIILIWITAHMNQKAECCLPSCVYKSLLRMSGMEHHYKVTCKSPYLNFINHLDTWVPVHQETVDHSSSRIARGHQREN